MMPIGEICNREVVVATRDMTVELAAQLMRRHHVGDLVIVDDVNGKRIPVGLVTDRDIVIEIIALGLDPKVMTVGDFMTEQVITAQESEGMWETIQHMRFRGVRRIPIVDDTGELAGIISSDDLLAHVAGEIGDLSRSLSRGREREEETRK
jgi:CBS domain-containing protein